MQPRARGGRAPVRACGPCGRPRGTRHLRRGNEYCTRVPIFLLLHQRCCHIVDARPDLPCALRRQDAGCAGLRAEAPG